MAVETNPAGAVSGDDDAIAQAFMDRFKGAPLDEEEEDTEEGSREETTEEETEEGDEGSTEEETEEGSEEETEEEAPAPTEAGDEALVRIKVGDQEHRVKVSELKRLFGQEAALTQRSQEAAELRRRADHQAHLAVTKLNRMVEKAQARLQAVSGPHADIAILARDPSISRETLVALRNEQEEARADLAFLQAEQEELHQGLTQEHQQRHQEAVQRSGQALTDPKSPLFVKDFGKKYQGLMSYGVKAGIPQEAMLKATDPVLFHLLDKAMAFDAGKAAVQSKVKIKPKVSVGPKSSAKPGSSADTDGRTMDRAKADRRLRETGSVDDAAAAFLARM